MNVWLLFTRNLWNSWYSNAIFLTIDSFDNDLVFRCERGIAFAIALRRVNRENLARYFTAVDKPSTERKRERERRERKERERERARKREWEKKRTNEQMYEQSSRNTKCVAKCAYSVNAILHIYCATVDYGRRAMSSNEGFAFFLSNAR